MELLFLLFCLAFASAIDNPGYPDQAEPLNIITNGYTAPEGKVPYIVFLAFKRGNSGTWCGGSLIANTWIVTASHCSEGQSSVTIYYGSNKRAQGLFTHIVTSSNIINHPSDDIALIRTPHVEFSDRINRVKLPGLAARSNQYVNQRVTACGWGKTTTTSTPDNLSCIDTTVISNAQCARWYNSPAITSSVLCTNAAGGKSICSGDSGGPLVTQANTILIGVSQFATIENCASGYPSGFTRVTSHLAWIKQHTGVAY